MEGDKVLRKSWDVSAFNRETNEWSTAVNHSYEHVPDPSSVWQATAAVIRPSRRKEQERDYTSIVALGDAQIGYRRILNYETNEEELVPLHDERKIKIARALARAIMPDIIVNTGDNIDLAEFSRFAPDSDHFYRTLAPSLQRVHDMYAELRADHPNARIVEVSSNHNERFNKAVLKQFPQMYGVMRPGDESKYPVLSYPHMANLEKTGTEWIGGYPSGEFIHRANNGDLIRFAHGTETSSGMSSAASKTMKNHPEFHNVQGHDHKDSEAWHTTRAGKMLGSFVIGALCRADGAVPGYYSAVGDDGDIVRNQQNWTASILHIRDYFDGGLEFQRVMIGENGAYMNGKKFDNID